MITDQMVKAGARAMAIQAGDDPDAKTYTREMACTGSDREPRERWEFWTPFSRVVIEAALALPRHDLCGVSDPASPDASAPSRLPHE